MNRTAVVILNWNGRSMLERFMPSVVQCTEADIFVADNGSTDTSLDLLRERWPQVRIIALDRNYGFAEGYNRAFAAIRPSGLEYEYYVLLNSDVECTPHWVEPLEALLDRQPRVAILQPKLLMYDQRDTFEYAGGAGGFIDSYGYPFCRGRLFSTLERDHGQYDDDCDIFWASGAAMMVRASVWHALGGLDGDFFAHMEEIDFCWRAKNAGHRVAYCPQSVLYHVGGGTLPKSNPFKTQLNFRNNLSMLYKNLPDDRLRPVLRLRIMLDRVAALKFLLEGHIGEYRAVRRAHREFRAWRAALDAKRQAIAPGPVGQVYSSPLLLEYFLLRRKRYSSLRGRFTKS